MGPALPRWLRIAVVVGCTLLAVGSGLAAYRYFTRPATWTVAARSLDGEAAQMLSAIASRLASSGSQVRLKLVDKGTALEVARAFAAGEVDLAIIRSDLAPSSAMRTVVVLAYGVVLIVVPPGNPIDSMESLKGKTIGVVGGEANRRLVDALSREYDLARAKVQFKDLELADVADALKARQVNALLVVMPVAEKHLSNLRGLFQRGAKQKLGLVPIESADAIAAYARFYESYELPKGMVQGSPPIPADDMTTLRVPLYLVANSRLNEDHVTALTKSIMDLRRELSAEYPLLAQISAPNAEKDAFIPIHPGAAVFFSGEHATFFDKYGDQLFYGTMLLGGLTSLLAGAWKFVAFRDRSENPLLPLYALFDRVRDARDESELTAVEEEMDDILKVELAKYADGDARTVDAAALSLAAHRLEHLINHRRSMLELKAPAAAG
jgi:TRAP transporter TAXI family solute receptor